MIQDNETAYAPHRDAHIAVMVYMLTTPSSEIGVLATILSSCQRGRVGIAGACGP